MSALASEAGAPRATGKGASLDLHGRWRVLDDLWTHRAASARALLGPGRQAQAQDIGEIAVIQDNGDIILPANAFDLGGTGLTFVPNAAGGFDVRRGDATFQSDLGTRLTLSDDDASNTASGFTIPFYGRQHAAAYINCDGNITFGESDTASSERDVSRFLTGPPRIAVAFGDLDPHRFYLSLTDYGILLTYPFYGEGSKARGRLTGWVHFRLRARQRPHPPSWE